MEGNEEETERRARVTDRHEHGMSMLPIYSFVFSTVCEPLTFMIDMMLRFSNDF